MASEKPSNDANEPTQNPEFKRVLGNLLKAPPKTQAEMKVGVPKKARVSERRKDGRPMANSPEKGSLEPQNGD